MNDFLNFIQFVKLRSINLKDYYFSGDLNCIMISKDQFGFSLLFRSDFTVSILIGSNETLLVENCSIDKMKKIFDAIFSD